MLKKVRIKALLKDSKNMYKYILAIMPFLIISQTIYATDCNDPIKSANDFYVCALLKDKRIVSLKFSREEREGRSTEAAQIPNPEVESEFNFDSNKNQNISILQPIEIGGKRSARIEIANAKNNESLIKDQSIKARVATDISQSLVKYRQLSTRISLLEEMKKSLKSLTRRLKGKAVRTPEEKTAVTIFTMQSTVLDTQLLSLKQDFKLTKNLLELSIGRNIKESEKLISRERKNWPVLKKNSVKETFSSKLALASLAQVKGEFEYQRSKAWPEISIGPVMEKQSGSDIEFGAKIEFVLPLFNTNGGAKQESRAKLSKAQSLISRTKLRESTKVRTYFEQYYDIAQFLKSSPSQKNIKKSVSKSLELFSKGMIQPSGIVESYRSTLETLEAVQEKELSIYKLYWMLQSYSGEVPKEFL